MKGFKLMAGVVIVVGLVIAIVSLYRSSVDSFMQKSGLIGADWSTVVFKEKIDNLVNVTRGTLACDLPTRLKGSVAYLLGGEEQKVKMSFVLGEARIKCGAVMLSEGKTEEGTYEVVKGIGYLKQGFRAARERVVVDRRVCDTIPEVDYEDLVGEVLEATSGKVYQVIWDSWGEVVEDREVVQQMCLDQRNSRR